MTKNLDFLEMHYQFLKNGSQPINKIDLQFYCSIGKIMDEAA